MVKKANFAQANKTRKFSARWLVRYFRPKREKREKKQNSLCFSFVRLTRLALTELQALRAAQVRAILHVAFERSAKLRWRVRKARRPACVRPAARKFERANFCKELQFCEVKTSPTTTAAAPSLIGVTHKSLSLSLLHTTMGRIRSMHWATHTEENSPRHCAVHKGSSLRRPH